MRGLYNPLLSYIGEVILSATSKGHDVFGLVATHSQQQSIISMLESYDDTQLEGSDYVSYSRKRGLDDDAETSTSTSSKRKKYTTRSSVKQLPSWSKDINPQNPLGVIFGD